MAQVTVKLPSLLAGLVDGNTSVVVEAETLRGALNELLRRYPVLKVHLFDESEGFRRHVLCFHNQEDTRWLESLDLPVATGDVITIMQAVSGGSAGFSADAAPGPTARSGPTGAPAPPRSE